MKNMLHKTLEPNVLNLFNYREAPVCPPYFETMTLPFTYNMQDSMRRWIISHTKGRYYIGKGVSVTNSTDTVESVIKVGFEDPKEASYFLLACPHLKYK